MPKFIPRLVKNDAGELCMQLALAGYTATLPLPPDFQSWTDERKENFYEMITNEMKVNLHKQRRTDQRKLRRDD